MLVRLEFVDSTFQVFIFILESERKAPAEARVMVASPKFGFGTKNGFLLQSFLV